MKSFKDKFLRLGIHKSVAYVNATYFLSQSTSSFWEILIKLLLLVCCSVFSSIFTNGFEEKHIEIFGQFLKHLHTLVTTRPASIMPA